MNVTNILVVDDEPQIRRVMRATLTGLGYYVADARSGEEALEKLATERFDLVLLDMNMPGMGGLDACREIRARWDVAVIVLTVRNAEKDKVQALDAGADDYITKPFSMEELLARVRANLRRVRAKETLADERVMEIGDLVIEPKSFRVSVAGEQVRLRLKEFQLLVALAEHQGQLATRQILADEVWGYEHLPSSRTIDVHIRRLRQAIEDPSQFVYIHTVHGMGYRFEPITKTIIAEESIRR
jgi:DNA-binding response OmpR family regulator